MSIELSDAIVILKNLNLSALVVCQFANVAHVMSCPTVSLVYLFARTLSRKAVLIESDHRFTIC